MASMEDNLKMALGDLMLANIQANTQIAASSEALKTANSQIESLSAALKTAQDELLKLQEKPAEPDKKKPAKAK